MSITYLEAIREAQAKLLRDDERVFIYGQDVGGTFGGALLALSRPDRDDTSDSGRRLYDADRSGRHRRSGDLLRAQVSILSSQGRSSAECRLTCWPGADRAGRARSHDREL